MNNNDPMRNVMGVPSSFGNSGLMQPPQNHQQGHISSQSQPQIRQGGGGPHYPGHFQLNNPHAQMRAAQAQFAQVHAQVQAQTANSRFPTQFQFQSQSQSQSPAHFQNLNTGNHGVSNVNVSSLPVSTPGSGSAKRANQRPPSRPTGSSNSNAPSPLKTMELTPAASRKKRKLPEMEIPDKVAAILPESLLYTQLLEFEAKVDALLSRKKIEIQDAVKNPPRVQKVLRIYIFNTFANQTGLSSEEAKNAEPPSWSLKMIGRILENGKDPVVDGLTTSHAKFSSFFKKITIYLDQNLYPDNHVILWESDRAPALHEGFEVRRKGDKEFTAIIRLEMNHVPEKFKLSPALSELIGVDVETRQRVLAAIWLYVKAKKLQIPSDPSTFMCDPPLQKLFGEDKMKFVFVPQKISSHLTALQPIHLEHKIKLSGNSPAGTTCYDVVVDAPLPLEKDMSAFLANIERHKDIDACDEVISSSIKKIQEHCRRRAFFRGFSQSPAEFINSMIASQSNDLKLAAGDTLHNLDKERHADFYNLPWVEDAVIRYLNRKSAVGSEGPGGGS